MAEHQACEKNNVLEWLYFGVAINRSNFAPCSEFSTTQIARTLSTLLSNTTTETVPNYTNTPPSVNKTTAQQTASKSIGHSGTLDWNMTWFRPKEEGCSRNNRMACEEWQLVQQVEQHVLTSFAIIYVAAHAIFIFWLYFDVSGSQWTDELFKCLHNVSIFALFSAKPSLPCIFWIPRFGWQERKTHARTLAIRICSEPLYPSILRTFVTLLFELIPRLYSAGQTALWQSLIVFHGHCTDCMVYIRRLSICSFHSHFRRCKYWIKLALNVLLQNLRDTKMQRRNGPSNWYAYLWVPRVPVQSSHPWGNVSEWKKGIRFTEECWLRLNPLLFSSCRN